MKNIPNIRILRKEVYVDPTFMRNGYSSVKDFLQYKDGEQWIDVPVENEYQFINTNDKSVRILGNY